MANFITFPLHLFKFSFKIRKQGIFLLVFHGNFSIQAI